MSEDDVFAAFTAADRDTNGRLDFLEFCQIYGTRRFVHMVPTAC